MLDLHPLRQKKKKKKNPKKTPEFLQKCPHSENQEDIHFLKNLHPLQTKILGMGLVEASQMHRVGELSPLNILSVGGWNIL